MAARRVALTLGLVGLATLAPGGCVRGLWPGPSTDRAATDRAATDRAATDRAATDRAATDGKRHQDELGGTGADRQRAEARTRDQAGLDGPGPVCGTLVYVTAAAHDGAFGGRSGLDAFCLANRPPALNCPSPHALISVDANDDIAKMPLKFGYDPARPVCWYGPAPVRFADRWADLVTGTIQVDRRTGTGSNTYVWTGTVNPDTTVDSLRYHCTNWTAAGYGGATGNHWNFNYWVQANAGSGAVAMPDVTTSFTFTSSTFQKKKKYGPSTCCAYNAFACPTACPADSYQNGDTLVCGGLAHLMCACSI